MNLQNIKNRLEMYFLWETKYDFTGWKNIKVFVGDTLRDAWEMANPGHFDTMSDRVKRIAMNSSGKWLEKQFPGDTYKVIVATRNKTEDDVCRILVHEFRHSLDYQAAVAHLNFSDYNPGNRYYISWSEYRATAITARYEMFSKMMETGTISPRGLSEAIGYYTVESMDGLIKAEGDPRRKLYFISRYLGATQALCSLAADKGMTSPAFRLPMIMPSLLTKEYGDLTPLAREWEELQVCPLNATSSGLHYDSLAAILGIF